VTILSIVQQASAKIGIERPSALFSSTEREHFELAATANDAARFIAERHDWNAIKRTFTITGNGETDAFDLPHDYDRMPKRQSVWTSRLECALEGPVDHDVWLGRLTQDIAVGLGSWTLLGGQIAFYPVLTDGETASYYYMSGHYATDAAGERKAAFTADDDGFALDDDLLRLAVIWMWKRDKGLPFEAAMADFMTKMDRKASEDRGSRMMRLSRTTTPRGIIAAYPRTVPNT
jgi:hypothetical protein